jgi:hypothetical protein
MRIASLINEIVQPARYVKQTSALDSVAVFKLRLTPVAGSRSIGFASEALSPEVESRITGAIEKGVMTFVTEREQEGRPVGGLCVTPFDIYVHPVDGRGYRIHSRGLFCYEAGV